MTISTTLTPDTIVGDRLSVRAANVSLCLVEVPHE